MTIVTPRRAASWCLVLPLPVAFALGAPGCDREPTLGGGGAEGGSPGVTMRDSAGIQIVENHAPERPAGEFWSLDPEPEIVLGGGASVEGAATDSAHLIWLVRGVARLVDGRVAVLSEGNRKLLLFEPSGRFSKSIGRGGRGPGEFSSPQHLQYLPPDTLVVWDAWYGPVAYFDTAGALLRHRLLDLGAIIEAIGPENATERSTPLGDGSFVAHVMGRRGFRAPPPGQPFRPPVEYLRIDSTYAAHSLGGSWGDLEQGYVGPNEGEGPFSSGPGLPLFLVRSHIAEGGHPPSIYISDGDKNEVHEFSPEGVLLRIIRRTTDPIPITSEAREAQVELIAGLNTTTHSGRRAWARRLEAQRPRQDSYPPVNALGIDPLGYLWIEDKRGPWGGQWSVFSPDGRWLGVLPVVPLWAVRWIGEDLLLGSISDQNGTRRIEGYRLNRWEP